MTTESITDREISTILAALRYFQTIRYINRESAFPDHFEREAPLDDSEINELCERLNFAEMSEAIR